MAEQRAIGIRVEETVSRLRHLAEVNNRSVERLREFRSALITAAVTGQINVITWGQHGQTDRRVDQIEDAMRA